MSHKERAKLEQALADGIRAQNIDAVKDAIQSGANIYFPFTGKPGMLIALSETSANFFKEVFALVNANPNTRLRIESGEGELSVPLITLATMGRKTEIMKFLLAQKGIIFDAPMHKDNGHRFFIELDNSSAMDLAKRQGYEEEIGILAQAEIDRLNRKITDLREEITTLKPLTRPGSKPKKLGL